MNRFATILIGKGPTANLSLLEEMKYGIEEEGGFSQIYEMKDIEDIRFCESGTSLCLFSETLNLYHEQLGKAEQIDGKRMNSMDKNEQIEYARRSGHNAVRFLKNSCLKL